MHGAEGTRRERGTATTEGMRGTAWGLQTERREGNRPADANGESSLTPVSAFYDGHLPSQIAPWSVEDLV